MALLVSWTGFWFLGGALAFIVLKILMHDSNRKSIGDMFKRDAWDD